MVTWLQTRPLGESQEILLLLFSSTPLLLSAGLFAILAAGGVSPGTGKTVALAGVLCFGPQGPGAMKVGRQCTQWEWHSEGQENPCSRKSRMENKKYPSRNIKRVSGHGSRFCQHWDTVCWGDEWESRGAPEDSTGGAQRVTSGSFTSPSDLHERPGCGGSGAQRHLFQAAGPFILASV